MAVDQGDSLRALAAMYGFRPNRPGETLGAVWRGDRFHRTPSIGKAGSNLKGHIGRPLVQFGRLFGHIGRAA